MDRVWVPENVVFFGVISLLNCTLSIQTAETVLIYLDSVNIEAMNSFSQEFSSEQNATVSLLQMF